MDGTLESVSRVWAQRGITFWPKVASLSGKTSITGTVPFVVGSPGATLEAQIFVVSARNWPPEASKT